MSYSVVWSWFEVNNSNAEKGACAHCLAMRDCALCPARCWLSAVLRTANQGDINIKCNTRTSSALGARNSFEHEVMFEWNMWSSRWQSIWNAAGVRFFFRNICNYDTTCNSVPKSTLTWKHWSNVCIITLKQKSIKIIFINVIYIFSVYRYKRWDLLRLLNILFYATFSIFTLIYYLYSKY